MAPVEDQGFVFIDETPMDQYEDQEDDDDEPFTADEIPNLMGYSEE